MMTEANGSWAKYSYDNLYRLLNESYSNGRSIGYTYDADGNRNTSREKKVSGPLVVTTYTYGKEDQLLTSVISGGSTTTFTYDKNGNEKTSVTGSATTTYAYDIENRLTSVTTSSSTTTYGYSAEGRRLKRGSGGTTTYFGNDPVRPSGFDDTIEEYGSTGTKTVTYLHGIGADELLGYKTTVWYDYHADALGSVTRLTDSTGATVSTYRYDAFGTVRAETGSSNTYEFTSREIETSSGLYYNRARYYDPGARQFIQKDPAACAGGSTSRYAYAGDNPVNNKDPSGKFCFPCVKWCQQWWGGWLPCGWGFFNVDYGLFQGCMFMNGIAYGVTATCLWGFFAYCVYAAFVSFFAGAGPTGFFACAALYCGPALFAAAGCFLLSLQCG